MIVFCFMAGIIGLGVALGLAYGLGERDGKREADRDWRQITVRQRVAKWHVDDDGFLSWSWDDDALKRVQESKENPK